MKKGIQNILHTQYCKTMKFSDLFNVSLWTKLFYDTRLKRNLSFFIISWTSSSKYAIGMS